MIDLTRFTSATLSGEPYRWGLVDRVFSDEIGAELAGSFPRDHFKTVRGYDGEKGYEYHARSLIGLGASAASHAGDLSTAWRRLAEELLTPAYREAISQLAGVDLNDLWIEVNVSHYGRRSWLGPHVDLADKVVTHVFYFNESWNAEDGGCLTILRSPDTSDVVKIIPPLIGNSVIIVRSEKSWHAVSEVRNNCRSPRRSMAVTFYRPGSVSTMWPPGDQTPLHDYREPSAFRRWLQEKLKELGV